MGTSGAPLRRPPCALQIKRFYEAAAVGEVDGGSCSDARTGAARTPARNRIVAPTRAIAEAIAAEWAGQSPCVDPTSMPMTRLANSAIDGVAEHPRRDQSRHCALLQYGLDLLSRRGAQRSSGCRPKLSIRSWSGPRMRWARG